MRMTTQMLNRSAQRAGLPLGNNSLLNYVNGGKGGSSNSLLQSLQQTKSSAKLTPVQKTKYEKLEKSAEALGKQADKFTATGEDSLFEKAKSSEDYTEVYKEIESLAGKYNSLYAQLASDPNTMNDFYRQSMQELIKDNKEVLSSIGITLDKQGKMQVDREKLEAADKETVEKIFGKEGKITSKLSFLAGRVDDNAETNLSSASGGYSARGDFTGTVRSRFDHRG